ncbi:MAG: hypothetical protein ACFE9L_14000 [Candidatus Hodarchaeota archaeon]
MKINAERMRIEEDTDNDLWLVDFRDEEKSLRGRIEIPTKIVSFEEVKKFEVEILSRKKVKKEIDYKDARIVLNVTSFRTKPLGDEKTYSFSAGGLMLRLFSGKPISEFKAALKEYILIIR